MDLRRRWLAGWSRHLRRVDRPLVCDARRPASPSRLRSPWLVAVTVILSTRNYARADPIGRRQIRGCCSGSTSRRHPAHGACARWPCRSPLHARSRSGPAARRSSGRADRRLIAIARSNLFDVDRLISATVTYNLMISPRWRGLGSHSCRGGRLAWHTSGLGIGADRPHALALFACPAVLPAQR